MSLPDRCNEWRIEFRLAYDGTVLAHYNISFVRRRDEWYDEIRFDSHDRRRGRTVPAPHFHLKIAAPFKNDPGVAVEEIRAFIDNHLKEIMGAIQK